MDRIAQELEEKSAVAELWTYVNDFSNLEFCQPLIF